MPTVRAFASRSGIFPNRKRRLRERRSPLPDARSRPDVFVGRVATKATVCDWERLPTYECLNPFTRAEGANDFRQACFAVRAR